MRSLVHQIQHNAECAKLQKAFKIFLERKDIKETIKTIFIDAQKQTDNSNKIKLEDLNWNKNPAIKQAAEQLGIFENAPNPTTLSFDTLDPNPDLKKILKEFGLIKTPSPKTRIKGKTVNFRDFVEGMVDSSNKSDLDVIDAEIVQEPIRIRIRDRD
jgi:hypothetical protein